MTFVGIGAKETKTEWPIEEGLEFGTTRQVEEPSEPEIDLLSENDSDRMS